MAPKPTYEDLQRRATELENQIAGLRETETALRITELWQERIFNSLEEAVLVVTPDRKLVNVNDGAVRMFGYSREELASLSTAVLHVDQDHYVEFGKIIQEAFNRGEPANFEFEAKRKNGEIFPTEHTVTLLKGDQGDQIGIVSVVRDITGRKRYERELEKRVEERTAQLVQSNQLLQEDITARKRAEEGVNRRNEELAALNAVAATASSSLDLRRILDQTLDKVLEVAELKVGSMYLLDQQVGEIVLATYRGVPKEFADEVRTFKLGESLVGRAAQLGQPIVADDVTQDSRVTTTLVSGERIRSFAAIPMKSRDKVQGVMNIASHQYHSFNSEEIKLYCAIGNQIGMAIQNARLHEATQRELTERKRMEEALAAEKERLLVTLRSIGDGVITTDTKGNILIINKVAELLTGWTEEEALGKPIAEVFHIRNEKTNQVCENPVDKVLEAGTIVGLANHTILISKDGTRRILADSGAPIIDAKGNITGVVLVFRDITDKMKMEAEIIRNQKLESLGILAGGLAHDFNNVLTTIMGNISLAKMDVDRGTSLYEFLEEAEKASQRATNLTQQLLTFAKGGAPVKETASLSEVLRESTSFSLRGSKVRADFVIPEGLWPVEIDVGQMNQVISNLVINADQAMPDGGVIQIQAENMSIGAGHGLPLEPGEYIRICIRDQGIGIPEKYLSKIFDPYFSTKHKGSGLGLTTVYSIVKKHDGHITVDSEVGVGTAFDIYLPASEKELAETKEVEGEVIKGHGRILVMDDEESIRDLARQSLQRLGYEVELAADGKEAIEKYEKAGQSQNPFDAVILDLTIPGGMGGKECIRRLKEIDPGVKAIVASGYADDPVMANFGDYGFTLSVAKPFSIEKLGQGLHHLLTGS
jgi:PAS domain S-box-containing protein